MKNRSYVISDENHKHRSRLIKAIQSINLEDYSNPPEGIWGCTAIIECNGVTIKSTELDLEFDIPFDDNVEADEGEITIYNLSKSSKGALTVGSKITIKAGYDNDMALLFSGTIQKVSTKRDGADKTTTIKVIDDIIKVTIADLVGNGILPDEATYDSGVTAVKILTDLLIAAQKSNSCESYSFPEPPHDYTYDNSVTLEGDLETEIMNYAEVCGVSVFKSLNTIYAVNINGESTDISGEEPLELNEETGLIESPEFFEETVQSDGYEDTYTGVEAQLLFNPTIKVTRLIKLKSEEHNGTYSVKSGNHSFDGTSCITKIKAIQKFTYSKTEEEEE